MSNQISILLLLMTMIVGADTFAHDGPDPVAHWQFNKTNIKDAQLAAHLGPDGEFNAPPKLVDDPLGQSAYFNGRGVECLIADDISQVKSQLPAREMTVSAWVAIEERIDWGAIIGTFQDNGDSETGWLLGYDQRHFYFGLASVGADDGDGRLTYLKGKTEFDLGRMYHVVATYDGQNMQLYVNGEIDASSSEQSGDILYPQSAPVTIGSYHDKDECNPMRGRIREIAIYDLAAKEKWVEGEFEHQRELVALPPRMDKGSLEFVVKPYLQYGTQTGMTVAWRSSLAGPGRVHWGETIRCDNTTEATDEKEIQQVRLENLSPETQYFYWVESRNANNDVIESDVSTFQTACREETPFAFAVISDTQENPSISGPIAELAWAHRPNFILHAGDLVDQGKQSDDWIDEFFASMHPLISRVPLFPVLGNHEQNAKNYFDYMALPDPEYYYQFSYGNVDFFMIDSNRKVDPASEQYQWLETALSESNATWKFVCHHHPPYSSDENDYGDLWKTNNSTRGDLRVRQLVPLYEKYGVDIVWNGHIHSYERTWPLKNGKAVEMGGTIYMITGGGGGGLETPGPSRPFFQNNVRRGHHYAMVAINGGTLEFKAFSLDDKLFDTMTITKRPMTASTGLSPSK